MSFTLSEIISRTTARQLITAASFFVTASVYAENSVTPAIDGVVTQGTSVEFIKDQFEGTEGPTSLPDGGFIFTETRANRVTRIADDNTTSTYFENSNGTNGIAFTKKGEIVSVQNLKPQV